MWMKKIQLYFSRIAECISNICQPLESIVHCSNRAIYSGNIHSAESVLFYALLALEGLMKSLELTLADTGRKYFRRCFPTIDRADSNLVFRKGFFLVFIGLP